MIVFAQRLHAFVYCYPIQVLSIFRPATGLHISKLVILGDGSIKMIL